MKSPFKLDRTSDRFRICPNCGTEHMVEHLGKDYCNDRCADEHYNKKRRLKKQAEAMLSEKTAVKEPEKAPEEEPNLACKGGTVEDLVDDQAKSKTTMASNLRILDAQNIDPIKGTVFSIESMVSVGFDFSVFAHQGKLHNTPPGVTSFFLVYPGYHIYRVDFLKVLIKRLNNQ